MNTNILWILIKKYYMYQLKNSCILFFGRIINYKNKILIKMLNTNYHCFDSSDVSMNYKKDNILTQIS
jgi:hypothetical protein